MNIQNEKYRDLLRQAAPERAREPVCPDVNLVRRALGAQEVDARPTEPAPAEEPPAGEAELPRKDPMDALLRINAARRSRGEEISQIGPMRGGAPRAAAEDAPE